MYVLGGVEAVKSSFNTGDLFPYDNQVLGVTGTLSLGLIVVAGTSTVAKVGPMFLMIVLLAIGFMSIGVVLFAADAWDPLPGVLTRPLGLGETLLEDYEPDVDTEVLPNFTSLLALFFPSVTGIMAGSNRSGVLADPGKSIPRGTLRAIAVSTALYIVVVVLFGLSVSNETLKNHKLVASLIAWPSFTVVGVGIVMSCVGAGLQSLTGAPQLLSSIAKSGSLPILAPLAAKEGKEPYTAILFTCTLAALASLVGNLDLITPFVTMFFLAMYLSINLACFFSAWSMDPSFRPTWRYFSWFTALLGTVSCFVTMFVISWIFAVVSLLGEWCI